MVFSNQRRGLGLTICGGLGDPGRTGGLMGRVGLTIRGGLGDPGRTGGLMGCDGLNERGIPCLHGCRLLYPAPYHCPRYPPPYGGYMTVVYGIFASYMHKSYNGSFSS